MLPPLLPLPARLLLLAGLLAASASCAQEVRRPAPNASAEAPALAAPYTFAQPDTVFRLPKSLVEISGLTLLDADHLGAVQDEKADLFVIDWRTGAVVDRRDFGKDRDYEGIELAGDRLFVLESDGTLYELTAWEDEKPEDEQIDTFLSAKYDTEGLAYDAAGNRLLIACKEYAGKNLGEKKAIYAFDLARGELLEDPAYLVDVAAFTERTQEGGLNDRIRQALGPALNLSGFKPSALAIHPLTQQVYVLSSVRKAVVVLAATGTIDAIWMLPDDLLPQPEALAFLPNGDLFIASEGAGGDGVLLHYAYHP